MITFDYMFLTFVFLSEISHVIFVICSVSYCFMAHRKTFFGRNCHPMIMMMMIMMMTLTRMIVLVQ